MSSTLVPVWEKLNLTIKEAAEYSNIGEQRIRQLTTTVKCPFVLYVGNKTLIIRKEFEKYITQQLDV